MDKESVGAIVDDFADVPNDVSGGTGGNDSGVSNAANDDRINGYATVNPGASGGTGGSRTGKRRGRPPGSRNAASGPRAEKTKGNISALENILLSVHFGVSALLSTPELELNEDEAKKFAGSLARISSLYDDRINPKIVAWVDLLSVAGAIYGPRAIVISARLKAEKAQRSPEPKIININTQRNMPPKPQASAARSPVDLFGETFYGATIPDAI